MIRAKLFSLEEMLEAKNPEVVKAYIELEELVKHPRTQPKRRRKSTGRKKSGRW